MNELCIDKMQNIHGGSADCAIATASVFLNTFAIAAAVAAGPAGWGAGALLFSSWGLSYAGMVLACPIE